MSQIVLPQGIIPSYSFADGIDYVAHPNGTIIRNPSVADFAHTINISGRQNMSITGVVFDGNGIKADNVNNVKIAGTVQNCKRTQADHQGFNGANLTNVSLALNYTNCNWAAIFNGLVKNLLIDGGTLRGCGLHLKAALSDGSSIEQRGVLTTDSAAYYQSEYQPSNKAQTGNIKINIHDCAMVRPVMGTANLQSNTGGWSVPMEGGNVILARNYFDGTTSDGRRSVKGGFLGPLMVFELGSNGGSCINNWVQYANDPASVNPVSQNCSIDQNLVIACLEKMDMQGGGPAGSNRFGTNDSTIILPADGGWKLAGVIPPGSVPIPPPLRKLIFSGKIYDDHTWENV